MTTRPNTNDQLATSAPAGFTTTPKKGPTMTPEEQLELVKRFYVMNAAGDQVAAQELLTDDFFITIPPIMPFAGVYRGKGAMQQLIPIVADAVPLAGLDFVRRRSVTTTPWRSSSSGWPATTPSRSTSPR